MSECKHERCKINMTKYPPIECAECGEDMTPSFSIIEQETPELIRFSACRQHVQRHALYTANDSISVVLMRFDNDKAMEDWEKNHPSWARVWWR